MGFGGVNNVVQIFPAERGVFIRESNNNMYRYSSYFWGRVLTEIPAGIIIPTVFTAIIYWSIGFNMNYAYKPILFWIILILEYNAFSGFGFILGTGIPNKQVVAILTPLMIVPQMLFCGFFVNQGNIP
jgi:ABC-type multidrug transport system permease subunit